MCVSVCVQWSKTAAKNRHPVLHGHDYLITVIMLKSSTYSINERKMERAVGCIIALICISKSRAIVSFDYWKYIYCEYVILCDIGTIIFSTVGDNVSVRYV